MRTLVEAREGLIVPGAFNALSARIAVDQGFRAVYLTGAGFTNMHYALPDLSMIGLRDIADCTMRIRDAVDVPVIVDADTGFGNAVNVWNTVRTLERAGADAIQLEDQAFPKRCGHFAGKAIIPIPEMVTKIRAAVDGRRDDDFLIIARTDAYASLGFEAAVERAARFAEAGADILFVEAVENIEEVRRLPELLDKPLLLNIVIGGKTPTVDASALAGLGYGLVLYANAALQGAVAGMQRALLALAGNGRLDEDPAIVAPFEERQRLVDKPFFDDLGNRYATELARE